MKRSINIIYGFLLLTGFLFLFSEGRGSSVGKEVAFRVILPFRTGINNIRQLLDAKKENDSLSRMVVSLSLRLQELREIKEENKRLRRIIGFVQESNWLLHPLQVVRVVSEAGNTVMVCKRRPYTRVRPDLPVIGYYGLIGKVKSVSDDYIEIQTLNHILTGIAVIDSRSRVFGILRWKGELYIEGVPLTADVTKGDTIVTSGMGAVYPKGIRVGIVDRVEKGKEDYQALITIRPIENMNFQEEIFVLERR